MNTKTIQTVKILVLALILSMGISYIFADWTAPLNTAPTCVSGNPGCDAPIHVGKAQWKEGGLLIGGKSLPNADYKLEVLGLALFRGLVTQTFTMPTGAGENYVLTSNAKGEASWSNIGGGGSGGGVSGSCMNSGRLADVVINNGSITAAKCRIEASSKIFTNPGPHVTSIPDERVYSTGGIGPTSNAAQVCKEAGYTEVVSVNVVGFGSCDDNYVWRFDRTTNTWVRYGACSYNSGIETLTCSNPASTISL